MERIWWGRVPNALAFSNGVINNLIDEKSVILYSAAELPWQEYFLSTVSESVQQEKSNRSFRDVGCDGDPGKTLLSAFCKPAKRAEYRPPKTYARFLAESDDIVLHSYYITVDLGENKKALQAWENFISDYNKERGKNKDKAVFILLWRGENPGASKKGITVMPYDDAITEYDRIAFAMLAAAEARVPIVMQDYLTELAANVAGNDIALCAECIRQSEAFLQDPLSVAREASVNDLSEEDINRRIWHAQIRTVYPLLEEYRESFIKQHEEMLQKALPVKTGENEECNDPKELELGTLIYMAGSGRIHLGTSEYNKLARYRDARNRLSHLGVLTLEEMRELGL